MKHIYTFKQFIQKPLLVALALLAMSSNAWGTWPTYSGSCSQSGYVLYNQSTTLNTIASIEYNLSGPGSSLTFEAKRDPNGKGNLKVAQYVDGAWSSALFNTNPGKVANTFWGIEKKIDYVAYSVTLDPKATKIKFYTEAGATLKKYVQKISVARFSSNEYALYDNNLDCGSADYNYAQSPSNYTTGTANVDWSHTASEPTCTITGTYANYFEISSKSNKPATNKYGTMSIVVSYKHTAPGDHTATLKVGSKTITVKGHTNKIPTYITAVPTVAPITYGDNLSNDQIGADGVVKADVIDAAGTVVSGTWGMTEAGQTVSNSGGTYKEVHLIFTPEDENTYQVVSTTANVFVRSASSITWEDAYSAEKPTIVVGKEIIGAATTTAVGETAITYSTSDPSVIAISADGTTFTAVAEGEATITASHGATTHWGAASTSKTFKTTYKDIQVIVWSQRFDRLTTDITSIDLTAQVYVENPVTGERVYNAERTSMLEYASSNSSVVAVRGTNLRIEAKGKATLTARVTGDEKYEEAVIAMHVVVRNPSEGCETELLLDLENNGNDDYLYEFFSMGISKPELISCEYAIDRTNGKVPSTLSFEHKGGYYKIAGLAGNWYRGNIYAEQKVNGSWSTINGSDILPTVDSWNVCENLTLNENATHIRFVRPKNSEGRHYVRNVQVTKKQYLTSSVTTIDFGSSIKVNDAEYRDITINYSDVKDVLSITSPGADFTIEDQIDVDCGGNGSTTLRLYYTPTSSGVFDGNLVISDARANLNCIIRVHADVQKAEQILTWNPETDLLTTETLSLNATTNAVENGLANVITYTSSDESVVSISDGVATIVKEGSVKITASQNGSSNFAAANPLERTFTITAETLTLTAPTTSAITYGNALNNSALSGGFAEDSKGNIVEGTFSWQDGALVPNAGEEQMFAVVFTPNEHPTWYQQASVNVPITVDKAQANYAASATISVGQALSEITEFVNNTTGLEGQIVPGSITWANDVDLTTTPQIGAYTYNISFISDNANYADGIGLCTVTVNEGMVFNGNNDDDWNNAANWNGALPTATDRVVINSDIEITTANTVAGLTINEGKTVTVKDGGKLTVGDGNSLSRTTYGNIIVEAGGQLILGNGEVNVNDFTLYSGFDANQQPKSGQVTGQGKLTTQGHAYFILDLDPSGQASYGWYTFAVPFPVDVMRGVSRYDNGQWMAITNGVNYAVMAYHENLRAQGQKGWKKYSGILQPGVGYTMTTECAINRYRFTKTDAGEFNTSMVQQLQASAEGETVDRGWNSLGNGTMSYITLDEEPLVQIYDHASNTYTGFNSASLSFAVGAAYFVQTAANGSELNLTSEVNGTIRRAPQREQSSNSSFCLSLNAEGKLCDNLFITCDDEAEPTYTIGRDVQKMGNTTGTTLARLWTKAKGTDLCAVCTTYTDNQAIIPMHIFAPADGEYTLSIDSQPADDVYLTRNGIIVWDMNMGDYTVDLNAGADDSYALQVVRRVQNVATGVEDVDADKHGAIFAEKMIVNGQLFILRDGMLFDAQGKKITNL